jgi:hypothetical protein
MVRVIKKGNDFVRIIPTPDVSLVVIGSRTYSAGYTGNQRGFLDSLVIW